MDEFDEKAAERVSDFSDYLTGVALHQLSPRRAAWSVLAGLLGALENHADRTPAQAIELVRLVLVAMRTQYEEHCAEGGDGERPTWRNDNE